jgi:hypothetical protein
MEDISQLYYYIQDTKDLGVGLYTCRPTNWNAADMFFEKAGDIIKRKFKSITEIIEYKKEFLSLPFLAVKEILNNPNFQTDSENSVYTIIMMWVRQKTEREAHLMELLQYIDFSKLSPYFLISIVSQTISEIRNEAIANAIEQQYYVPALEELNGYQGENVRSKSPVVKHSLFCGTSGDKFAMKVEFRKISDWTIGEKYYSQPIFSNGFLFYFFMRAENSPDHSTYLAGYLRCTCEATSSSLHFLPVTVTFEIVLNNSKTRKFPQVPVVFDHYDRSIGSRMNAPTDSWEKIRNGQSDIVKDDKIVVIISVEFLKTFPYECNNTKDGTRKNTQRDR